MKAVDTLQRMRDFSESQIRHTQAAQEMAESRLKACRHDAYNQGYWLAEIERCTKRMAYFQTEVDALDRAIELMLGL